MVSVLCFAHDEVGANILKYLLETYRDDVSGVVVKPFSARSALVREVLVNAEFPSDKIFEDTNNEQELVKRIDSALGLDIPEYLLLLWWPSIVGNDLLALPSKSTINTHPSFLPYCRGKDPNFWAIVDDVPFGVTMHEVTADIDSGSIISQLQIEKTWLDNGQTLYEKSKQEMVTLFKRTYPTLRTGSYTVIEQDSATASIHYRRELESTSRIELDKSYTGRQFINLLRARTFPPHPACWFRSDGEDYEVTISIKRVNK